MTEAHSFARSLCKWINSQLSSAVGGFPRIVCIIQVEAVRCATPRGKLRQKLFEVHTTQCCSQENKKFSISFAVGFFCIFLFCFVFLLTSQLQLNILNFSHEISLIHRANLELKAFENATFQVSHPLTQRLYLGSLPDGCMLWIHPRIRDTFHLALHAPRNVHFKLHTCRLDMVHVSPQWCSVHLFFMSKKKAIETRALMKQICSNRTSSSFPSCAIASRGWSWDVLQFVLSGN